MKKQFVCIWTGEYPDEHIVVDETFFNEERGYNEEVCLRIDTMEVGNCIVIEYGHHYVIRIKDIPR